MRDGIGRVCVIGLGYVGLPTAAVLASRGVEVIGVDIDPARVDTVNSGRSPFDEPGLNSLVTDAVSAGTLTAQGEPAPADAFIVAVPTPIRPDRSPDLSYVQTAVNNLAPVLQKGTLVVVESTCPVGTTESVCKWLQSLRPDLTFPHTSGEASDVRVAYCAERILPGNALKELGANDRIIGGVTPACAKAAKRLYEVFVEGACHITTVRTAELAKLAENAFRDVNIAFANEISLVSKSLNIDPWGDDSAREPASQGGDSQSWSRSRGPLHSRRSLVHRRRRAPFDSSNSDRATGQRRDAKSSSREGDLRMQRIG